MHGRHGFCRNKTTFAGHACVFNPKNATGEWAWSKTPSPEVGALGNPFEFSKIILCHDDKPLNVFVYKMWNQSLHHGMFKVASDKGFSVIYDHASSISGIYFDGIDKLEGSLIMMVGVF